MTQNDAILLPNIQGRLARREYVFNAKKAFDILSEINNQFLELKDEQDGTDWYNKVYSEKLEDWISACDYIKKKYKNLIIDEYWFEKNYKHDNI